MAGMDRRSFLTMIARGGALGAALGVIPSWARSAGEIVARPELLVRNAWPEHYEATIEALGRSWITPVDRFFVRSHFPAPEVSASGWKLEVTGLVRTPLSIGLDELRALPSTEDIHTLECAGNGRGLYKLPSTSGTQWAHGAVGNAAWKGAPLEAILRRAEVQPEAKHVWFEAADTAPNSAVPRFLRSIPLEKAMSGTLLAYDMNGAPLTRLHGAPLRAIVPGWFGMAWTKWVTKIRVEATPSDNHFYARGYRYVYPGADPAASPPVEEMVVKSLITKPLNGARVAPRNLRIQGFAWAGPSGVTSVEISTDEGKTWKPAGFSGEHSPTAWRMWSATIEPKPRSTVSVMARATDGRGATQPLEARANGSGYANNSIHKVTFRVG